MLNESKEIIEDLIIAAHNDAKSKLKKKTTEEIENSFLESEKKQRLKNQGSRLYETTAWSFPIAYGLDGYYTEDLPPIVTSNYIINSLPGIVYNPGASFGYIIPNRDQISFNILSVLMGNQLKVLLKTIFLI